MPHRQTPPSSAAGDAEAGCGGGHTAGGQMGEYEDRSTHSPRVVCQVSKSRVVVPTLSQKKYTKTQNRRIFPSPTALLCTHIPTHPLSVHKRDASPNGASSLDCCFLYPWSFVASAVVEVCGRVAHMSYPREQTAGSQGCLCPVLFFWLTFFSLTGFSTGGLGCRIHRSTSAMGTGKHLHSLAALTHTHTHTTLAPRA